VARNAVEPLRKSGLPGEHRHVMPGIGDRLAAAEAAPMFADDRAILADHDAIGIGLDLDRLTARQAASSGSAHTWSHVLSEGTNCAHIRQARSKVVRRIIH
jgi:hypothetical protein